MITIILFFAISIFLLSGYIHKQASLSKRKLPYLGLLISGLTLFVFIPFMNVYFSIDSSEVGGIVDIVYVSIQLTTTVFGIYYIYKGFVGVIKS